MPGENKQKTKKSWSKIWQFINTDSFLLYIITPRNQYLKITNNRNGQTTWTNSS